MIKRKIRYMLATIMFIGIVGLSIAIDLDLIPKRNETINLGDDHKVLRDAGIITEKGPKYTEYSTGGNCYIIINEKRFKSPREFICANVTPGDCVSTDNETGINDHRVNYNCITETPQQAFENTLREIANVTRERNNKSERHPDFVVNVNVSDR